MAEKRAINPYNFIPFEGEPQRKPLDDYYREPLESGWIDVRLTVKTPLIIPDGASESVGQTKSGKPKIHKTFSFFCLPDRRPAIPGSSLRGMLRSVYEAASNSCLPFLAEEPKKPISQRTPIYAAFKERALLEYDKQNSIWRLHEAKATLNEVTKESVQRGTYCGCQNAQRVNFDVIGKGKEASFRLRRGGSHKGYLQFNIPVGPGKYHVAVLQPGKVIHTWPAGLLEKDPDNPYRSLHGSVYDTVNNLKRKGIYSGPQHDLCNAIERVLKDGGMVPCYYFIVKRGDRELVYLSGAAAGRVQQRRTWKDIMAAHNPCDRMDQICPACALFGSTGPEEKVGKGFRGRLRFTDALPVSQPTMEVFTLPILSTPRSSSFEFYLRKPADPNGGEVTYWNFDYYGVKATQETEEGKLQKYTSYHDLEEATPRGRKMYWHQGSARTVSQKSHMNATMEAVKPKSEFQFRVYFDKITASQLQDLLWTVTLGENDKSGCHLHKLGHGKPAGYGSVKLTVLDCVRRRVETDDAGRIRVSVSHEQPETDRHSDTLCHAPVAAIRRMSDFNAAGYNRVEYLTGVTQGKNGNPDRNMIFTWFQKNRMNAESVLTLPEPLDDDLTLPTARKDG